VVATAKIAVVGAIGKLSGCFTTENLPPVAPKSLAGVAEAVKVICNDLCENDKVMEKETNKTKWLHVRLTEDEQQLIRKKFKNTDCRKLSDYIRRKLLDKHLVVSYRNGSLDDFMTGLSQLKTELNHIGNNLNQAVKKLNSMRPSESGQAWITIYENTRQAVADKVAGIDVNLKKITDQWLQNSRQDHP
jgi:hypothetical protein